MNASHPTVVGVRPWLPWPLGCWRWLTAPVRAERLAALRIGLASLLLFDLLTARLPAVHDFYGPESLGSPELFDYLAEPPKWNLSLLRGFRDPLLYSLALGAWWVSGGLALLGLVGRLKAPRSGPHPLLRAALLVWTGATVAAAFGLWSRVPPGSTDGERLIWVGPLISFGAAAVFFALAAWRRLSGDGDRGEPWVWRCAVLAFLVAGLVAGVGLWKSRTMPGRAQLIAEAIAAQGMSAPGDTAPLAPRAAGALAVAALDASALSNPPWLAWAERSWHHDKRILHGAMLAWVVATALLLVGLATRFAAVAAWALALSFANLNWHIDNAGEQIRGFILFYLMLSPCGAAWSVDSWLRRRLGRRPPGPLYVWPWPLRLLFVQMVFIYFLNGTYKLLGDDWKTGASLYHVLCDVTLSRFSYTQLPISYELTRWMSWAVVGWEVSFPLLVLFRWTRAPALVFGALFHLGIFAFMELGGFGLYMLTLYAPLLPWDRWLRGPPDRSEQVTL